MTSPKTASEKLAEIREEQARKKAEFDAEQAKLIEAVRLENEAAIAAEEAVAKAAAEEFEKAEKAAEVAYNLAQAKKKAAQKAAEQHKNLFGKTPATPSSSSAAASTSTSGWVEKLKGMFPSILKFIALALVAWVVIWGYFAVANFLGDRGKVENAQVTEPSATFVPESEVVVATPEMEEATVAAEPTLEPTLEPTSVQIAKAPASTKKPKPAAKSTAVAVAPAIPVTWNSGPTATYKPVAGMICHGDLIGPYGSHDGTHPVIVQFWSDQPEPLVMIWASCEVNTGRNLKQIKTEIEAKYSKTFEEVNN